MILIDNKLDKFLPVLAGVHLRYEELRELYALFQGAALFYAFEEG